MIWVLLGVKEISDCPTSNDTEALLTVAQLAICASVIYYTLGCIVFSCQSCSPESGGMCLSETCPPMIVGFGRCCFGDACCPRTGTIQQAPPPQQMGQPSSFQRGNQQIVVTVPPGMQPGMIMQIRTPNGQLMNVQIPQNAVPNSQFSVNLPADNGISAPPMAQVVTPPPTQIPMASNVRVANERKPQSIFKRFGF
eukprot:g6126.t1